MSLQTVAINEDTCAIIATVLHVPYNTLPKILGLCKQFCVLPHSDQRKDPHI